MLVDTHSHLFVEEFETDLPEVIQRAKSVGVSKIFMPNIDLASLSSLLNVCRCYKGYCFPMLGLHPTSVSLNYQEELSEMKTYLKEKHPFVAIGEVGLDFYWDKTYACEQMRAFDEQIQWAIDCQLPLVIHCREAFSELYACLKPYKSENLSGIFHCFTGSPEDAVLLMEFGRFMFGVNGAVTYKKSVLPETLKATVPISRIVLETDSPYLSPMPYRGKRNETSYIIEVAKKIADIYEKSVEEIGRITTENASRVFDDV